MVEETPQMCIICAWRENCQKKFFLSKETSFRCTDFTRDVSIKLAPKSDDLSERSPAGTKANKKG